MPHSATFWNLIAKRYARQPVADPESYQRKLARTRAELTPQARVFEFGCGTGSTALAHAPHAGVIDAIDISPRMIAIARDKAAAAGVRNVAFEVGAIETHAGRKAHYDAVLAMSILHLLPDRTAALARAFDMLRPGGVLASSTACLGDGSVIFQALFRWVAPLGFRLGLLPYVRVFTRADLEAAMRRIGFVIEESWQPGPGKAVFILARKPA